MKNSFYWYVTVMMAVAFLFVAPAETGKYYPDL
jgi:hypothetical protein